MITFKLSFLLAADLGKACSKPTKAPKRKSSKSPRKLKKPVQKTSTSGDYIPIAVKDPISHIEIEYELFPNKLKYKVDVICWGSVAKIFSNSGCKYLKTVVRNNTAWIPVSVEHYLNPLPTNEVRDFLNREIPFTIRQGKGSFGPKSKLDKISVFYIHKDDLERDFAEVYPEESKYHEQAYMYKDIEKVLEKLMSLPEENKIVSWIYSMDIHHAWKMLKTIAVRSRGGEVTCKEFYRKEKEIEIPAARTKKKKAKTGKSAKRGKPKEVSILGQVLLSDPAMSTYHVKEWDKGSKLAEIFILLSSQNLLTDAQKAELSPLLLKINKINNLPVTTFIENGYRSIYASCSIPDITEFTTPVRPVEETVHFNESQCLLTADIPKIKMMQIFQTQRVLVKIFGVKGKAKVGDPLLVACFDLSPLSSTSFFLFKEKGQCHTLRFIQPAKYLQERITINDINLHEGGPKISFPLTEDVLLWKSTTLQFEARCFAPQYPSFYINNATNFYKRIVLIVFDRKVASTIFHMTVFQNHQFLTPGPVLIPNLLSKRTNSEDEDEKTDKILSGFVVDDGNCFIFALEGTSNGTILSLIHYISNLNLSSAKVFYNSEYMFEERLYKTFVRCMGIFLLTLKSSLADIFATADIYIEGNVPVPCFKAIQKLNLICNSTTLKTILSHELLPTDAELVSLSFEFGFQPRFKNESDSLASLSWSTSQITSNSFPPGIK